MSASRKMPEVSDAERLRSVERQCRMVREQRDAARAESAKLRDALTNMVTDHPFVLDGDNGAMVASWFIHEAKQALGDT